MATGSTRTAIALEMLVTLGRAGADSEAAAISNTVGRTSEATNLRTWRNYHPSLAGVEEIGAGVVVPLTGNNWTVGFERADRPLPQGQRPPDVVLGTVIGGATAAAAARVLASILFATPASDPATFGTAAAVLIATAMAACYVPARRAARVDPARTLADQ